MWMHSCYRAACIPPSTSTWHLPCHLVNCISHCQATLDETSLRCRCDECTDLGEASFWTSPLCWRPSALAHGTVCQGKEGRWVRLRRIQGRLQSWLSTEHEQEKKWNESHKNVIVHGREIALLVSSQTTARWCNLLTVMFLFFSFHSFALPFRQWKSVKH